MVVSNVGGYTLPVTGTLDEVRYPLTVTVNPCQLSDLAKDSDTAFEYEIGKPSYTTG